MLIFIIASFILVITAMYFIGNTLAPFLLERSYNKNKVLLEKPKAKNVENKPSVLQEAFELEAETKFLDEFFLKYQSVSILDLKFDAFTLDFYHSYFISVLKMEFVRMVLSSFNKRHTVQDSLTLTYLLTDSNIKLLELFSNLNHLASNLIKSGDLDKDTYKYIEDILLNHVYVSIKGMYLYNLHMSSYSRYRTDIFNTEFYDKIYFKTENYYNELKEISLKSTQSFIRKQFSFIDSTSNNSKINKIELLINDILLRVKEDVSLIEIKVIVTKMKSDLIPKINTWSSNNNVSIEDLKTIDIVLDKIINLLENYNSKIYSKEENLSSELAVINRYLGYLEKDNIV